MATVFIVFGIVSIVSILSGSSSSVATGTSLVGGLQIVTTSSLSSKASTDLGNSIS